MSKKVDQIKKGSNSEPLPLRPLLTLLRTFLSNIDFVLIFFFLSIFRYGAQSLIVSRFLHHIVALYQDPTAPVRDAAAGTLVEIYRHIGDRVRVDLQKKHNIPPAK